MLATAAALVLMLPATTRSADDPTGPSLGYGPAAGRNEGILVFESEDGRSRWWVDGRVMFDGAYYSEGENELASGAELRRVRLSVKTILHEDWAGELDIGFADDEVEVKDAWLGYIGLDSTIIRAGNHKEPFSLEELTSSRYTTFMERALPNVFAPGRHLGLSYSRWAERWTATAGFFGEEAADVDETGEDDGYSVTGRFTALPLRSDRSLVHVGASASYRTPPAGSDDRVRFRVRPETHVNRERFLNTGRIKDVDSWTLFGVEAAAAFGPVSLQGEYIKTQIDRFDGEPSVELDGWYAYASWFPTGESRPYDVTSAEFGRVTPKRRGGAVELALRYSAADLNDLEADVEGGKSEILTFGANWYANSNVRLMLNVSRVQNDVFADADGDLAGNDDFTVVQLRAQLTF